MFRQAWEVSHVVKYSHERLSELPEVGVEGGPRLQVETLGEAGLRYRKVSLAGRGGRWAELKALQVEQIKDTADKDIGCEMYLRFTPNEKVEADKIGLIQNVKSLSDGAFLPMDDTRKDRTVKTGPGKDTHLDMFPDARSPVYGASVRDASGDADKLTGWKISAPVTEMSAADKATNAASGR